MNSREWQPTQFFFSSYFSPSFPPLLFSLPVFPSMDSCWTTAVLLLLWLYKLSPIKCQSIYQSFCLPHFLFSLLRSFVSLRSLCPSFFVLHSFHPYPSFLSSKWVTKKVRLRGKYWLTLRGKINDGSKKRRIG